MEVNEGYKRPPIVEAVIDFRFGAPLTEPEIRRVRSRFEGHYPSVEEVQKIEVAIGPGGVVTNSAFDGFMMRSRNGSDICLVRPSGFTSVRLAPYPGWDAFEATAQENFKSFTNAAGRHKISRIGVRFINRIDIPLKIVEGHDLNEFFTVGPSIPENLSNHVNEYSMKFEIVDAETGVKIIVNTGISHPALLECISVLLDIDTIIDRDIPERAVLRWEQVRTLRHVKNRVFENCITDRAKELFQ